MQSVNNVIEACGDPVTLDDLGVSIIQLINKKFKFHNIKNKVIHMSWNVEYDEKVSCSQQAPIGKRTNFCGTKDRPRHYPGWAGRIWIVYIKRPDGMASDPLNRVHIHKGTGGYGNYSNPNFKAVTPSIQYPESYALKIFEDDWAAMRVHNNLIGAEFPKTHEFVYTLKYPYGDSNEES